MKLPKIKKLFGRFKNKSREDKIYDIQQTHTVETADIEIDQQYYTGQKTPITSEPGNKKSSPLRLVYCSHRGSGANETQYYLAEDERTPENSLASFKKAFKNGVKCIEFDVCRSIDGVLMVSHANDLAVHSLFKHNDEQPEEGQHLISKKTALDIQQQFDISNIRTIKFFDNGEYIYEDFETGEHIKSDSEYERDYQRIPTLHNLFEEVSKENIRKRAAGLPNVMLNMELKGDGVAALVDKHIEMFNFGKSDETKINYEDIHFLSFNKQDLLDIAEKQPKANLILGVPTIYTYMKADEKTYAITDFRLNKDKLDEHVLGLNEKLKKVPYRKRGLDGVDMSLWDIGDEVLEYYGKHKIPISMAVAPHGKKSLEHEYLAPALDNIQKISAIQGRSFDEEEKPFIFVKTDTPSELQRIVENSKQSDGVEKVVSAKEYIIETKSDKRKKQEVSVFPKPLILFKERPEIEKNQKNVDDNFVSR